MSGIRAKLAIPDPKDCPLASIARDRGETLENVRYTRAGTDDRVVEEFGIPDRNDRSGVGNGDQWNGDDPVVDETVGLTEVFANERSRHYQFERESKSCTCEMVEEAGHPIARIDVRDGILELVLNLEDASALRDIIAQLSESGQEVDVRYLMRHGTADDSDPVVVDRQQLTARQREVLETAYETGYFDYPRRANATDVADDIGIAPSTFSEHLAAAQSRLLETVFE